MGELPYKHLKDNVAVMEAVLSGIRLGKLNKQT